MIAFALVLVLLAPFRVPGQNNPQPHISIRDLEARTHDLINVERRQQDHKPLRLDAKLSDIARAHSRDMAERGFFDHVNPDGKSPADRGKAAGMPCRKDYVGYYTTGLAENIFQNNLYSHVIYRGGTPEYIWNSPERIATTTVRGWMESPGHRTNILRATYTSTGIGVAVSPDDKVYLTQVFC